MELEHEEEYKYKLPPLNREDSGLFVKVSCPSCSASVPAANINIIDKICKCSSCDSIFALDQSLDQLAKPTEELKRPEGIDMIYFEDELDITLDQPPSLLHIILLSFAPFFTFMFIAVFLKKDTAWALYTAIPLAIASIYALISIIKRGKIYLTIDDRSLNIKHRPKHFKTDKSYDIRDIDQVFIKTTHEGITLMMVIDGIKGEKHQRLIGHMKSLSQAKYLEQEIERHLGIKNRKVAGEMQ